MQETQWDTISIPRLGRSPGEGLGNPLQYSCLENPLDRGAWRAIFHLVTMSQTWLSDLACTHAGLYTNDSHVSPPFSQQIVKAHGWDTSERIGSERIDQRRDVSLEGPPKESPVRGINTHRTQTATSNSVAETLSLSSSDPSLLSFPPFHSFSPFVKQAHERPPLWKVSYTRNYYFYVLPLRVHFSTIHTIVGIFFPYNMFVARIGNQLREN